MTGQQFQDWAVAGAQPYATQAQQSAEAAANSASAASASATSAAGDASDAEAARQAIEDMGVASVTLDPGLDATVDKIVSPGGAVTLRFGIPQGAVGPQGATGPAGAAGQRGPQGVSGLAVPTDSQYAFTVDANGHLICSYTGDTAPEFSINEDGHLILAV